MADLESLVDNEITPSLSIKEQREYLGEVAPMLKPSLASRFYYKWNKHLNEATSISVIATPIYAAMQNYIDMAKESSLINRAVTLGLTYTVLGKIYTAGLERSQDFCGVDKKDTGLSHIAHDTLYSMIFAGLITPPLLLLGNIFGLSADNLMDIVSKTGGHMVMAAPVGWAIAYAIPSGKELMGFPPEKDSKGEEKPKRWMPNWLREGSSTLKKRVALGLVAASAILTAGIYSLPGWKEDLEQPLLNTANFKLED